MYEKDEYIMYGGEGVCRVVAVGDPPSAAADPRRTYYTLQPLSRSGIIYTPTDTVVPMRPIMTKTEAWTLLHTMPELPKGLRESQDARRIETEYRTCLNSYDSATLFYLVCRIYEKNTEAIHEKKGYGQTDSKYFKRAKELLGGELAHVLEKTPDEAEELIMKNAEELCDN